MTYSRQKQVALSKTRLDRAAAEEYAASYYCHRHPTEVRSLSFACESCIRDGYEVRIGSVVIGGKRFATVTVPEGL